MQQILSNTEIEQKINRLGFQLLENCFEEKEIFIGGIAGNGDLLAKKIANIVSKNSDVNVHLFSIELNKNKPWSEEIKLNIDRKKLENGYVVLVDDVLNSGKTMQYALVQMLEFPTKAIKTLALVDRKHRRFPIKADFVGISLSTTLKERVEVDLTAKGQKAYLV